MKFMLRMGLFASETPIYIYFWDQGTLFSLTLNDICYSFLEQ